MKSGLIEERIETFGSGRTGASSARAPRPLRALWTLAMSVGRSLTATLLLLTWADTISAGRGIRVSSNSLLSAIALETLLPTENRGSAAPVAPRMIHFG